MTKEEILYKKTMGIFDEREGNITGIFEAMEEYAKKVLDWLLTHNHPDYEGERIIMQDGNLWWASDHEGDYELGAEEIIKLYENDNKRSNA